MIVHGEMVDVPYCAHSKTVPGMFWMNGDVIMIGNNVAHSTMKHRLKIPNGTPQIRLWEYSTYSFWSIVIEGSPNKKELVEIGEFISKMFPHAIDFMVQVCYNGKYHDIESVKHLTMGSFIL